MPNISNYNYLCIDNNTSLMYLKTTEFSPTLHGVTAITILSFLSVYTVTYSHFIGIVTYHYTSMVLSYIEKIAIDSLIHTSKNNSGISIRLENTNN